MFLLQNMSNVMKYIIFICLTYIIFKKYIFWLNIFATKFLFKVSGNWEIFQQKISTNNIFCSGWGEFFSTCVYFFFFESSKTYVQNLWNRSFIILHLHCFSLYLPSLALRFLIGRWQKVVFACLDIRSVNFFCFFKTSILQ